jgi:hypothetical protein
MDSPPVELDLTANTAGNLANGLIEQHSLSFYALPALAFFRTRPRTALGYAEGTALQGSRLTVASRDAPILEVRHYE